MEKIVAVICLHGDEHFGFEVAKHLRCKYLVGNPEAVKINKRFVETDMNRSFSEGESYENNLARQLLKKVENSTVIDIHATDSKCGVFGIITKANKDKINLCRQLGLEKVVIMSDEIANGKSLIDNVELGVSIEIGQDKQDEDTAKEVANNINNLDNEINPELYQAFKVLKGEYDKIYIENFKEVKKGELIFEYNGEKFYADRDFIPILVGEEDYDFVCIMSRKCVE